MNEMMISESETYNSLMSCIDIDPIYQRAKDCLETISQQVKDYDRWANWIDQHSEYIVRQIFGNSTILDPIKSSFFDPRIKETKLDVLSIWWKIPVYYKEYNPFDFRQVPIRKLFGFIDASIKIKASFRYKISIQDSAWSKWISISDDAAAMVYVLIIPKINGSNVYDIVQAIHTCEVCRIGVYSIVTSINSSSYKDFFDQQGIRLILANFEETESNV